MKTITLALSLAIFLIFSCDDETLKIPTCDNCSFTCLDANEADIVTNTCPDNYQCTFSIIPQSKVNTNEQEGRSGGDKNVFQMILDTEGSTGVADDEFTNILVFELDESQSSFSAEGNELAGLKTHYRRICYCLETEFQAINSGCLQGEKQADGSWYIQGNLTVVYSFGNIEVKVEALFIK